MKFVLHRNTENRNQKIPFPAMQVAGLADAEQLTIQADAGSTVGHRNPSKASRGRSEISRRLILTPLLCKRSLPGRGWIGRNG